MLKDYKGDKVINRDSLISYFFNYDELENILDAVQKEKQNKLEKYGLQNYQMYMEKESKSELYTRFIKMKGEF